MAPFREPWHHSSMSALIFIIFRRTNSFWRLIRLVSFDSFLLFSLIISFSAVSFSASALAFFISDLALSGSCMDGIYMQFPEQDGRAKILKCPCCFFSCYDAGPPECSADTPRFGHSNRWFLDAPSYHGSKSNLSCAVHTFGNSWGWCNSNNNKK